MENTNEHELQDLLQSKSIDDTTDTTPLVSVEKNEEKNKEIEILLEVPQIRSILKKESTTKKQKKRVSWRDAQKRGPLADVVSIESFKNSRPYINREHRKKQKERNFMIFCTTLICLIFILSAFLAYLLMQLYS